MNEKDLSTYVEGLLDLYKWRWCHFKTIKTETGWLTALSGHKGFPDYVAVRDGVILFAELKGDKGKATDDQLEWMHQLSYADHRCVWVYLWRPSDIDRIKEILE